MNCLIYDYDVQQNTVERSQGLKKLLGYSLSETETKPEWWYERIHPSQRNTIQEKKNTAALGAETSICLEYQVRHRDGYYIWVQDRAVIVRDESGVAVGIVGGVTDISDRKVAEQRSRESEERLQLGVAVAGVALARFDYGSNIVELSPEAAVLYGFCVNESVVMRDRFHATFHPEDQENMAQIIQQLIDPLGNGWFEGEHRVVWSNGEVRWLYVRQQVFFDCSQTSCSPDYGILAAIDITERKQAEVTLEQQLAQIEAIYTTAPVGLCFLDRQRRFVQMNERLAEINGLPVSEHLGRTVREILPELAEIQEPIFEQVFQTGLPILDIEVQGTTPARPEVQRHWLVSYYPLTGEDRQVIGINITVLEITERKVAEAERDLLLLEAQAARKVAEAANRDKDEFVAVVAHELRSPINSVAGWAQLLRMDKFNPATIDQALDAIERGTQTQVQLIEDLLDISRMDCGTLRLTFAPVDLPTVIEAAINSVRPMADDKLIDLETKIAEIAHVSGDINRLQQIVVNLLNNAIKFTPSMGRVTITLELVDGQARIKVKDTGKGISPDFLPQVFERFEQAQENSGSKDGLGLGLAIVKNLVELHNGTITATSLGLGAGATFTVWLPLLEASSVVSTEPVAIAKEVAPLAGIRVLAVDDQPDCLELLRFILENAGAKVQVASSGSVALDLLDQFNADVLVSALVMPDINGHQLLQQIKTVYQDRPIIAIAITAYDSSSEQDYVQPTEFEKYFSKPIEPNILVQSIISLLNKGRSE